MAASTSSCGAAAPPACSSITCILNNTWQCTHASARPSATIFDQRHICLIKIVDSDVPTNTHTKAKLARNIMAHPCTQNTCQVQTATANNGTVAQHCWSPQCWSAGTNACTCGQPYTHATNVTNTCLQLNSDAEQTVHCTATTAEVLSAKCLQPEAVKFEPSTNNEQKPQQPQIAVTTADRNQN